MHADAVLHSSDSAGPAGSAVRRRSVPPPSAGHPLPPVLRRGKHRARRSLTELPHATRPLAAHFLLHNRCAVQHAAGADAVRVRCVRVELHHQRRHGRRAQVHHAGDQEVRCGIIAGEPALLGAAGGSGVRGGGHCSCAARGAGGSRGRAAAGDTRGGRRRRRRRRPRWRKWCRRSGCSRCAAHAVSGSVAAAARWLPCSCAGDRCAVAGQPHCGSQLPRVASSAPTGAQAASSSSSPSSFSVCTSSRAPRGRLKPAAPVHRQSRASCPTSPPRGRGAASAHA